MPGRYRLRSISNPAPKTDPPSGGRETVDELVRTDMVWRQAPRLDGSLKELGLNVFTPGKAPCQGTVVFFHAGGFVGGTHDTVRHVPIATELCRHGWAVAFPAYRIRGDRAELSVLDQHMQPLRREAERLRPGVRRNFYGRPALGATEDGAAFLTAWPEIARGLGIASPRVQLWGSSAGGIIVLNILFLAGLLKVDTGHVEKAAVFSGGFLFDPKRAQSPCPILARHNRLDERVPFDLISSVAEHPESRIHLETAPRHVHGSVNLRPFDAIGDSVDRIMMF